MLSVAISGVAEVLAEMKKVDAQIQRNTERAVARTVLRVETVAKRRIQRGPKTGEVYEKYLPRRTHQASQEGQAPASDTGRLANSIEHSLQGMEGFVFTRVEYAPYLEFGTAKIKPRPFLFPSLEENTQFLRDELQKVVP